MIRTINERLKTNKEVIISKEKKGLSKILFAIRSKKGSDGNSAFEKHTGREPNTPKSCLIENFILEKDPAIEIEREDFSEEADSIILICERVRGSTLEGAFKKVRGKIMQETNNTITVLHSSSKKPTTYSKRDVAANPKVTVETKESNKGKMAKREKVPKTGEMAKGSEKAKRKRTTIKSGRESEDLGQVISPKHFITPTPKKDASNSKDLEPNAIERQIEEDNNSSVEPESTTANTQTTENAKDDAKRNSLN